VTLDVVGLHSGYAGLPVLFGIDFRVDAGEIVAILGQNGAGKSTLLETIMGTTALTGGDLFLEGRCINALSTSQRVAAGIAFSPEGRRVFPNLTALENLIVGAKGVPSSELEQEAEVVYDLFPVLRDHRHQRARMLSGGEQQMLAIGRALMARPRLLLIEEPSQGLAPAVLDTVYDALRSLCDRGVAVLLVEQFQKYRPGYAGRVLVLDKGTLRPADDTVIATDWWLGDDATTIVP